MIAKKLLFLLLLLPTLCFAQFKTGVYYVTDSASGTKMCTDSVHCFYLNPTPIVTIKNYIKIKSVREPYMGTYDISIALDKEGTVAFDSATKKAINKLLAFVINNKVVSAPMVRDEIKSGKFNISGSFYKKEETDKLVKQLLEEKKEGK